MTRRPASLTGRVPTVGQPGSELWTDYSWEEDGIIVGGGGILQHVDVGLKLAPREASRNWSGLETGAQP